MLVKEIFEKLEEMNVAQLARDHLEIGEKKLRNTLKSIGATQNVGRKGWTYEGDQTIMEKSIYDIANTNTNTNDNEDNNNEDTDGNNTSASIDNSNKENKDSIVVEDKNTNKKTVVKRNNKNSAKSSTNNSKAEIEALMKNMKSDTPSRVYKGVYFDNDIANFLDNVNHGKRSELINKIIRQYLIDNDLMQALDEK